MRNMCETSDDPSYTSELQLSYKISTLIYEYFRIHVHLGHLKRALNEFP